MENIRNLENENRELKAALALLLNKRLIKELSKSLERINSGDYLAEDEFFKNSPQESS